MNRLNLMDRVRSLTRDFAKTIFLEIDVIGYLNEGVDRIKQVIPELKGMVSLDTNDQVPTFLPSHYHYLISLYSASRCFGQDERHYQATNFMNEFEQKLNELKTSIENGQTIIIDPITLLPIVVNTLSTDFVVTDNYFETKTGSIDVDKGVGGVTS